MTPAATATDAPGARAGREALAWGAAQTLVHLPLLAASEQGPDGARFVAGVQHFDLAAQAPHAPGYPLYIALGKAVALFGADAATALAIVGALSLGGLTAATFFIAAEQADRWTARAAALVLAAMPLLILYSLRPMSDVAGAAAAWGLIVATLAAWRGSRAGHTIALVGFGLLGGLRPSVLPLVLPAAALLVLRSDGARRDLALIAGGVTAWAAPLLSVVGPGELLTLSAGHINGHFTKWGGSVLTSPDAGGRIEGVSAGLGRMLGVGGGQLGGLPGLAILLGLGAVAAGALVDRARLEESLRRPGARLLLLCGASYGAWALLAQNVASQPRHLIPLAPLLALGVALGGRSALRWLPALRPVTGAVLASALALALGATHAVAIEQARTEAPAVRAAAQASSTLAEGTLLLTTGGLERWLRLRTDGPAVRRVDDLSSASTLACLHGGQAWITDDVPGAREADLPLRFLALGDPRLHFRARRVALRELVPQCVAERRP